MLFFVQGKSKEILSNYAKASMGEMNVEAKPKSREECCAPVGV